MWNFSWPKTIGCAALGLVGQAFSVWTIIDPAYGGDGLRVLNAVSFVLLFLWYAPLYEKVMR